MMSADEKVAALHGKMALRRRRREQRKTAVIGAASVLLGVCMLFFIYSVGTVHGVGTAGMYSGSMMLFENAGAYVLVAVVAFTLAVIITVLCIRYKERSDRVAPKERKCSDNHYEEDGNL